MKLKLLTTFITFYSSIHEIRKHYQTRQDENLNLKRELTEKGNWNETISLSVCKQWHQCRRAQNSWVHIFFVLHGTRFNVATHPWDSLCKPLFSSFTFVFSNYYPGVIHDSDYWICCNEHKNIPPVVKWSPTVYPW